VVHSGASLEEVFSTLHTSFVTISAPTAAVTAFAASMLHNSVVTIAAPTNVVMYRVISSSVWHTNFAS
jgi:hypothetical protein